MERQVVIYESSSHGGNYNYALELYAAFLHLVGADRAKLLLPANAAGGDAEQRLLQSEPQGSLGLTSKLRFLHRQVANPRTLMRWLDSQPPSLVLLNDFEQLTAHLWAGQALRRQPRHRFVAVMHDPDRSNYLGRPRLANATVRKMLSAMYGIVYHDYLPDQPYYSSFKGVKCKAFHPIYAMAEPEAALVAQLQADKAPGQRLVALVGALRREKQYEKVIAAIKHLPDTRLLIAGRPANSTYTMRDILPAVEAAGLTERTRIVDRYLSPQELAAVFTVADLVPLLYGPSFKSQSGILNQLAPFRTPVLTSAYENALTATVRENQLGMLVENDAPKALAQAMEKAMAWPDHWESYLKERTWQRLAGQIINCMA